MTIGSGMSGGRPASRYFVIVAGVFTALVYAVVEIAYRIVNPKART